MSSKYNQHPMEEKYRRDQEAQHAENARKRECFDEWMMQFDPDLVEAADEAVRMAFMAGYAQGKYDTVAAAQAPTAQSAPPPAGKPVFVPVKGRCPDCGQAFSTIILGHWCDGCKKHFPAPPVEPPAPRPMEPEVDGRPCRHCGMGPDLHWSGQYLCRERNGETSYNPAPEAQAGEAP